MNKHFLSSKGILGNEKRNRQYDATHINKKTFIGDTSQSVSQHIRAKVNSLVPSEGTSAEIIKLLGTHTYLNKTATNTEGSDYPVPANKDAMNEMPLTEKFSALLTPYVPIPLVYQKLSFLFKITDSTLNFARLRDTQPIFPTLRHSIAENHKATIKLSHIQQFLTILPNCYKLD